MKSIPVLLGVCILSMAGCQSPQSNAGSAFMKMIDQSYKESYMMGYQYGCANTYEGYLKKKVAPKLQQLRRLSPKDADAMEAILERDVQSVRHGAKACQMGFYPPQPATADDMKRADDMLFAALQAGLRKKEAHGIDPVAFLGKERCYRLFPYVSPTPEEVVNGIFLLGSLLSASDGVKMDRSNFGMYHTMYYDNKIVDDGSTALMVAVGRNDTERIRYYLGRNQDINAKMKDGNSVLHVAVKYSQVETLDFLVQKGADPAVLNSDGRTPLLLAAHFGKTEHVRRLVQNSADVNVINSKTMQTAVHEAVLTEKTNVLCLLIERGADINRADKEGFTALMYAARQKNGLDSARLLIEAGADVESIAPDGSRPLMITAALGHLETGKLLLEHGAKVNAVKDDRSAALDIATASGQANFSRLLLKQGADARRVSVCGYTAATWASGAGNCPEVLPDLFDIKEFSVDAIKAFAEKHPERQQILVEALVCASDIALRENQIEKACSLLQEAVDESSHLKSESEPIQLMVIGRFFHIMYSKKDYIKATEYASQLVIRWRKLSTYNPKLNPYLYQALGHFSWCSLLCGNLKDSVETGEETILLIPTENPCPERMNLAHAYLFNGQFEKAKAIYAKYLGTAFKDGRKWNDELSNDFKALREVGRDHPDMKKIEALLEKGSK